MNTIKAFCANCQTETDHTYTVDSNGELVFACAGKCNRFFKLPAGLTTEEYQTLLTDHKEANLGQVSLQGSIDALEALVAAVNEEPTTDTTTPAVDTTTDTTTASVDTTTETVEAAPIDTTLTDTTSA